MHTDEEVERCYEEFYEDVHTEFLKFGEIVNFKVCRNGSFHLRGNVYIHYKSLDSAVLAYHSVNGRYFAGKQVTCEFVSLTRWKIAICGEYMKSRLKTCSRGTACNFLHCFDNPGGDYEWADSDKPPPRYWVKKMTALFGYSDDSWYDKQTDHLSPRDRQNSSRISTEDRNRYHPRRHQSRETDNRDGSYSRSSYEKHDARRSTHRKSPSDGRKRLKSLDEKNYEEETKYKNNQHGKNRTDDTDSDGGWSYRERDGDRHHDGTIKGSRHKIQRRESRDYYRGSRSRTHESVSDEDLFDGDKDTDKHHGRTRKRSRHWEKVSELSDDHGELDGAKLEQQRVKKRSHSSRSRQRIKSHDIDSRYVYDEDVDEVGHRESENDSLPEKQKRSKRKFTVDENVELYSPRRYNGRSKSQDTGYSSDEDNDEKDRWEPDKSSPEKHHSKSRRKPGGDDREPHSVTSKSHDQNSGEWFAGSRPRGSRWSSRERCPNSLEEVDSAEELQKLEENNKQRYWEKHKSRDHNHKGQEKKSGI